MLRFSKFLPLIAVAAVFGWASSADAGFQITLRANGVDLTVTDNQAGPGGDDDSTVNTIQLLNRTVNGVTFSGSFTATNVNGTPTLAFVDAGVNQVGGTGPITFEIVASASGFTSPTGPLSAESGGTFQFKGDTSSTATGTFSLKAYLDQANTLATDDLTVDANTFLIGSASTGTLNGPNGNENIKDARGVTNNITPYSLTFVLGGSMPTVGATYKVDVDGTLDVRPIPAPAGLVLLASGAPVLGLGLAWVRRRKMQVKNA